MSPGTWPLSAEGVATARAQGFVVCIVARLVGDTQGTNGTNAGSIHSEFSESPNARSLVP